MATKKLMSSEAETLEWLLIIFWFFFCPAILMWGWNWLGPDFVQNARQIGYGTAFGMTLILKLIS